MGVKDQVIRLLLKADQFLSEQEKVNKSVAEQEKGFNKTQAALVTFNSTVDLAQRGLSILGSAIDAVTATIERGQSFSELSSAFDTLYGSSQALSGDGLGKLREALKGTVTDLDLLKSANQAAAAGLSAENFLVVAEAAETLGDKLGKGPNQALEELSKGLAVGLERNLKFAVGVIDSAKAEDVYAASIGKRADQLSEAGKLAAFQAEVIRRLKEEIAKAGESAITAGDGLERMNVSFDNAKTRFATGLNQSEQLGKNLDAIGKAAADFPWEEFGRKGGDVLVALTNQVAAFTKNFLLAVDDFFDVSLTAKVQRISELSASIPKLSERIDNTQPGLFQNSKIRELTAELDKQTAEYVDLVHELERMELAQRAVDHGNKDLSGSTSGVTDKLGDLTKSAKEAKDSISAIVSGTFDIPTGLERIPIFNTLGLDVGADMREQLEKEWPKMAEDAKQQFDDSFQQSADFFAEALYNSMTGVSFDIEDLFKRLFAGVAGGFIAELTKGFGAGLGTPQGIGELLGKILAGGSLSPDQLGSLGSLGNILGLGGSAAAAGSVAGGSPFSLGAGTAAGGFDFGSGLSLGGGAAGGAGLGGNFASLGLGAGLAGGAAIILTGAAGLDFGRSISQGQRPGLASSAVLAPVTGGLSLLPQLAPSGFFGGGISGQQAHLGDIVNSLIEQGVLGEGGKFSGFGGGEGRLQASQGGDLRKDSEEFVGLSNTFSLLTQGGIDEQFSGLFANALNDAGSFNEALLTVNGLLDKAGISADQAGESITQAYLDGTISIEEFNQALGVTAQLASGDLASLEDAADLLAASFGGPPRDQLKALELQFHELKDAGITETSAIINYFATNFPGAEESIQDMIDAGIDLFGDFSTLTIPQIQLVLNEINQMQGAFAQVGNEGEDAANRTARGFERVEGAASKTRKTVQGLNGDLRNVKTSGAGLDSPGVQP